MIVRIDRPQIVSLEEVKKGDSFFDTTCAYSTKSPYQRCAVNPSGPCQGCEDYKAMSGKFRPDVQWAVDQLP